MKRLLLIAAAVLALTSGALAQNATKVTIIGSGGGAVSATSGNLHVDCVTGCGGSGTGDVNLVEVGGAAISLGQNVMASSIPVAIASNQTGVVVQGAQTDDSAYSGALLTGIGGIYVSTLPTYTTGDAALAHVGSRGSLHTELWASDAAVPASFGATNADDIAASGTFNKLTGQSYPLLFDGTTFDRMPGNTLGAFVQGNVAVDAVDTGNPVKTGCRVSTSSGHATVATNDRQDYACLAAGVQLVLMNGANGSGGFNDIRAAAFGDDGTSISGMFAYAQAMGFDGTNTDRLRTIVGAATTGVGTLAVHQAPNTSANAATAYSATTVAASGLVLKASAGNFYGANITTGGTAGYLMLFDATSAPADGTVTPARVWVVAANSSLEVGFNPPIRMATGITLVFSSTGPFTKTASATAFMSGEGI